MRRENENYPVISLSDESFKHYLIHRYGEHSPDYSWENAREEWSGPVPSETLIQLYKRAKEDIENSGGRIVGYEVVDDVLISHEAVNAKWPENWMWVLQFNNG